MYAPRDHSGRDFPVSSAARPCSLFLLRSTRHDATHVRLDSSDNRYRSAVDQSRSVALGFAGEVDDEKKDRAPVTYKTDPSNSPARLECSPTLPGRADASAERFIAAIGRSRLPRRARGNAGNGRAGGPRKQGTRSRRATQDAKLGKHRRPSSVVVQRHVLGGKRRRSLAGPSERWFFLAIV